MNNPFERIVLIVALCILLATLTVIAMTMIKGTTKASAHQAAACPDYWYSSNYTPCAATEHGCCTGSKVAKMDETGSNCGVSPCDQTIGGCCPDGVTPFTASTTCPTPVSMCHNLHELGKTNDSDEVCVSADFSSTDYQGTVGMCKKQKYAKECKVSWDGVSNVPDACF